MAKREGKLAPTEFRARMQQQQQHAELCSAHVAQGGTRSSEKCAGALAHACRRGRWLEQTQTSRLCTLSGGAQATAAACSPLALHPTHCTQHSQHCVCACSHMRMPASQWGHQSNEASQRSEGHMPTTRER